MTDTLLAWIRVDDCYDARLDPGRGLARHSRGSGSKTVTLSTRLDLGRVVPPRFALAVATDLKKIAPPRPQVVMRAWIRVDDWHVTRLDPGR